MERATSPKVQKTTTASSVSVARYCTRIVAEAKSEESAAPARMIASAESCRMRAKVRMIRVAPMAPAKAKTVTEKTPAANATTARAAPKAAHWLMPGVEGEPSGFFSRV